VPWAGSLWVITYAPHFPRGSADKLYQITPDLQSTAFAGSVGGTPANRMIHRETNQLIIGPYVIDDSCHVRVIRPEKMPGRLTGNARHLFEPERKVYYATMEEGLYEVDLRTLDVQELFRDDQAQLRVEPAGDGRAEVPVADLPGYHGKGLYSGQGRLVYANNGEGSPEARRRPDVPSGCLAEWDGHSRGWRVIRRSQFTDVRGPGGIHGNEHPETDPIWAIGWDHRSLLLMLLDDGRWSSYRLPKASHAYDGAHGWNTEWPRIQEIGEPDLAMNMHGMFWRFPRTFSRANSAGLAPRCTYLRVIGDYCRWQDQLVFGCDDTARSEFLNTRRAKGAVAGPGQSHSNLWFADPDILDRLGIPLGRGAVWLDDAVRKNQPSDPYLFSGFRRRSLCLAHDKDTPVTFSLEVDLAGDDCWSLLRRFRVGPGQPLWHHFSVDEPGTWLRLSTDRDCQGVTAHFHYSQEDPRTTAPDGIFAGLATPASRNASGGLLRVRGGERRTLAFAAARVVDGAPQEPHLYELDGQLQLRRVSDRDGLEWLLEHMAVPQDVLAMDQASAVYVDDEGRRWRLPKGDPAFDAPGALGAERVCREVVTERDLLNCHGTFYELPARNAGGFARIRPICTHNRRVTDYCSYRGLLVLSGVEDEAPDGTGHVVRSNDGQVALWVGVVDDLWRFGKPVGVGGPWRASAVTAGQPSDPYLMTGFDKKSVSLSSTQPVTIHVELDITGAGHWQRYRSFRVRPGRVLRHEFPAGLDAYWVRLVATRDAVVTAEFVYQ
jgi:hypothetical protein